MKIRIPLKEIILENMNGIRQGMPKFGENTTGVRHNISTPNGGHRYGKRTSADKTLEYKQRNPVKTDYDIQKGDNSLIKTLIRQDGMNQRAALKASGQEDSNNQKG